MVHVPYHGAQPALTDVMSGNVDMFFDTLATRCRSTAPAAQAARRRRPRALQRGCRSPHIAESGLPGFSLDHLVPDRSGRPACRKRWSKDQPRRRAILRKPPSATSSRRLRLDPMIGTPGRCREIVLPRDAAYGAR